MGAVARQSEIAPDHQLLGGDIEANRSDSGVTQGPLAKRRGWGHAALGAAMRLSLYQVDAFTSTVFSGNPAAVVPLEGKWLPDETMQAIAAENNLSETAFLIAGGSDSGADFELRWFTPAIEVDLCGHATLATAWVLMHRLGFPGSRVDFATRCGRVSVDREDDLLILDFPARPGDAVAQSEELTAALGVRPETTQRARDLMVVLESEAAVRNIQPDLARLAALDALGIIVTAPGRGPDVDFVSRFFAPRAGIAEDPVTGSAHCTLVPYWAERLNKTRMRALQFSKRGGELFCRHDAAAGRVHIGGRAILYLEGTITI